MSRPKAHVVEDVTFLLEHDPALTTAHLADRLHISVSGLQRALTRAGRTDLLNHLTRNARRAA